MQTEDYKRVRFTITEFDAEDVITTSGVPGGDEPEETTAPDLPLDPYEGVPII